MADKSITKDQLVTAGNEWLKMQFITGRDHFGKVFTEVSTNEYLTLLLLAQKLGLHESKVYLKEICEEMEMAMSKVSPRVRRLQERGLVYWNHDKQGTFITLSEIGISAMKKQQELIADFIAKTVEAFGYEKFLALIETRRELNTVMDSIEITSE